MEKKLKYFSLAVFLGIICKLYDDIVDNNLYSYFNISNENEPYFNEIMKSLFIIGYTVLSIEYPVFLVGFTALCFAAYLYATKDFNPYDFSCFVSPIVAIPFLKWNKVNEYYKSAAWLLILSILVYLSEAFHSSPEEENREYNNKKLYTRALWGLAGIIGLKYQSVFYIPDDLVAPIIFFTGYNTSSAISQYCFLNGILKSETLNIGSELGNERDPSITKKEVTESREKEKEEDQYDKQSQEEE